MRIDINEVRQLIQRRKEINSIPLDQIEWVDGDKPLEVAPGAVEEWKFIGMSNLCFIETEAYKGLYSSDEDDEEGDADA